jgi:hypothetical protein
MVAVAIAAMPAIPVAIATVSTVAVWVVINDAAREQGAQGNQQCS